MAIKTAKRTHKAYGNERIEAVIADIKSGLSQQEAAKKNGVSGWTVTQWKMKGKLGNLPKGRITKEKTAKAAKAAKAIKAPKATAKAVKVSTGGNLQAEVNALRTALKALVSPAKLAAYKAKLQAEAKAAADLASAF